MKWTPEQKQQLRQCYPTLPPDELVAMFGRNLHAIRRKAEVLGVQRSVWIPRSWRPLGSERLNKGVRVRKVSDTGHPKRDWKRVDRIEWEALHGPLPPGKILVLRHRGLPRRPEHLLALTPREHFALRTVQVTDPDMVPLYCLKGQIMQALRRLENRTPRPSPKCAST